MARFNLCLENEKSVIMDYLGGSFTVFKNETPERLVEILVKNEVEDLKKLNPNDSLVELLDFLKENYSMKDFIHDWTGKNLDLVSMVKNVKYEKTT